MIRENYKSIESDELAPVDDEPLGTRINAPQGRVPFGFHQNPYGRAIYEPEIK